MGDTKATKPGQLVYIQACRGLAALSVVLYHTNITLALNKYIGEDIFPIFNAGFSGVEFFFVLSGFIIFYAHSSDIGKPSRLVRYAVRRITRIVPALWITLLLILLLSLISPHAAPSNATDISVLITDFLMLPAEKNVILSVEWTLRCEMFFYFVFAVFLLNRSFGTIVSIACLILSLLGTFTALPFPLAQLFSVYNFLFLFGFLSLHIGMRMPVRLGKISIALGTLIFFATWALAVLSLSKVQGAALVIFFGIGAMLLIAGIFSAERGGGTTTRPPAMFTFLGEASYSIYLIHFPIVSALCKIVTLGHQKFALPNELAFIIVFLGATIGGIVFHIVLERPALALLRRSANISTVRRSA